MSNISDLIEQFILSNIGDDCMMELSRNELASYFAVAPSQINYVLSTRFTVEKGFVVEGKRGGGGCIRLMRVASESDLLKSIYDGVGKELTERQAAHILGRLYEENKVTEREFDLLIAALSNRALSLPTGNKNEMRASVMKAVLERMMQYREV